MQQSKKQSEDLGAKVSLLVKASKKSVVPAAIQNGSAPKNFMKSFKDHSNNK
jgi:hypothetical protein